MKIVIPTSINDIKLKDYLAFKKISENEKDPHVTNLNAVMIFCGLSEEQAKSIPLSEYEEILRHINSALNEEPKFTNRFHLNGIEFGFIPNLEEMTAGEYIDLDTYLQNEDTWADAAAILFRPIKKTSGQRYSIEKYISSDHYREVMDEMPVGIIKGAVVFFYHLGSDLLEAFQDYLQGNTQIKNSEATCDLMKNGGGILQSIKLQMENVGGLNGLPD